MLHIVIGQIGGRSMELEQTGCICPSTQRHTQAARAGDAENPKVKLKTIAMGTMLRMLTLIRPS